MDLHWVAVHQLSGPISQTAARRTELLVRYSIRNSYLGPHSISGVYILAPLRGEGGGVKVLSILKNMDKFEEGFTKKLNKSSKTGKILKGDSENCLKSPQKGEEFQQRGGDFSG